MRRAMLAMLVMIPAYTCVCGSYGNMIMLLKNNPSTLAMGNAVTGIENGETAGELNPASLVGSLGRSISVNYMSFPEGIKYQQALVSYRVTPNTVMGVNLNAFQSGDIESVDNEGNLVGVKYNDNAIALGITFARRIEKLVKYRVTGIGMTLRMVNENLESETSTNFLTDLGMMFKLENNDRSRLGISVRNIGTQPSFTNKEDTPVTVSYGISRWFFADERLLAGISADSGPGKKNVFAVGGEYRVDIGQNMWGLLRGGYTTDRKDLGNEACITAGLGIMWENMGFNYVWRPSSLIGDINAVELKYQFTPKLGARLNRYAKVEVLERLEEERTAVTAENKIRYEQRKKDADDERDKAIFTQGVTEGEIKDIDAGKNAAEAEAKRGNYEAAWGKINQATLQYREMYIRASVKKMLEEIKETEKENARVTAPPVPEEQNPPKKEPEKKAGDKVWTSYQRGLKSYLKGDMSGAINNFESYIDGNDAKYRAKALVLCADAYAKQGFSKFMDGDIKEASRMWQRGNSFDGDNELIKKYMEEYIAVKCNDYFNKGIIAYSNGNIKEAKACWEECLNLNAEYDRALKAIKRIQ